MKLCHFFFCPALKGTFFLLLYFVCVIPAKNQILLKDSNANPPALSFSSLEGQWYFNFYENGVVEVQRLGVDSSVSILPGLRRLKINYLSDSVIVAGDWKVILQEYPLEITFYYKLKKTARWLGLEKKEGEAFSLKFDIKKEKFITGGGMRAIPLNVLGRRLELRNQPRYGYGFGAENLNYSIPLFIMGSGYALFFDNTSKGWADIGFSHQGLLELEACGGRVSFCLIPGNSIDEITRRFTDLTGHQPLPPLWAFGHLQSRMAYKSQYQVDSITRATLQAGFPLDAMVIDLFWFGNSLFNTMGNLDWYQPHWPEPVKMLREWKGKGVKTVLITEPYIVKGSNSWHEADSLGILGKTKDGKTFVLEQFYFGHGGVIDVTHPEARRWIWKKYDTLLKQGVEGWWIDLAEPEHHPDGIYYSAGTSELIHNAFGHLWDKMLYDNYQVYYPDRRIFNLNRSGFAGSQRYGVLPWTGDVSRSWSGLKAQIPILLNMGMCGVAYVHSDAGGFAQGVFDEELYIRWLQFACFSPILRPHGSGIPSEPIFYSQPTQDIVRYFMRLRYQLLPYNYTLAYENTQSGTPLARAIFASCLAPQNDLEHWSYFWGPSLLISPIVNKNEKWHLVRLPEGEWYYFFNDKVYKGNRRLSIQNKLEEFPIFVKAGSFLPMVPPIQNTAQYNTDTLLIHYYPLGKPHQSSFSIYIDDGEDSHAIENKRYEHIHLFAKESYRSLHLSFRSENLGLQNSPNQRLIKLLIHGNVKYRLAAAVKDYTPDSSEFNVLSFSWDNRPVALEFITADSACMKRKFSK